MPVACRRSISSQSGGFEHVITVPVSFSTQRKAGMSWFEPSRMPAWLAPVCDERSVSHSVTSYSSSTTQRPISGAVPSRIARRSTGSASPSISRKMIPGTSVCSCPPVRRAIRRITRSVYVSSSFAPRRTSSTTLAADATSAASSAQPKWSTEIASGRSSAAIMNMSASSDEHEQQAEDERVRERQRGDERREHRVEDRDQRRRDDRAGPALDPDAGDDRGGQDERGRRQDPVHQQAEGADAQALVHGRTVVPHGATLSGAAAVVLIRIG